ncbi:hypothetical protein [Rhizobium tubonense]|uniref:PNPLA domain-containing protein n=1 Tax=Rhizobium tubonense TaxID=484088 RepID=A0A2W4C338_9HYPH|nr:hypothetical protein [Rhizobium tubonense]PZM08062.1 hypothetical protein CPY51_30425 [Rhizobium tubonense]
MTGVPKGNTWRGHLSKWAEEPNGLFGEDFFARYGDRLWDPTVADQKAAHSFHVELISRIATQPLGYSEGIEDSALTSIFDLFAIARSLSKARADCKTFEVIVWHIFNSFVRPFTAKWHPKSQSGELHALDSSDIFRAELEQVQSRLVALDSILNGMTQQDGYGLQSLERPANKLIGDEMSGDVKWRPMGEPSSTTDREGRLTCENILLANLSNEERTQVEERRKFYAVKRAGECDWASGIALSGGGIRSATFAMGVLVSLSRRNLLRQFDYLSTVSGGGYAGSFLTQLLGSTSNTDFSLASHHLPFRRDENESLVLQRIRQGASYLSASAGERLVVALAQIQGVLINLFLMLTAISTIAYGELRLRRALPDYLANAFVLPFVIFGSALLLGAIFRRSFNLSLGGVKRWMTTFGVISILPLIWSILGALHQLSFKLTIGLSNVHLAEIGTACLGLIVVATVLAFSFSPIKPLLLLGITTGLVILAEALAYQIFCKSDLWMGFGVLSCSLGLALILWFFLDVNSTSLHDYYRKKLAASFLVNTSLKEAVPIKLSEFDATRAMFPIINCALNVPGSKNPKMRGRHSDLFSFTPVSAGANLIGQSRMSDWENANTELNLATAMALSGAAVSPLMGLNTTRFGSFWLTLLNIRLGAWLREPSLKKVAPAFPNVSYLFKELAATATEEDPFLQISDGGHIENLGVYELLRRRCRFIVAVDGEHDGKMTFHALTNLQRLAYIDFGIVIDANLADLRLGETGLSRSHFRFCRIRYPADKDRTGEEIGYLIYLKLSLTGNEGEFIRRYKLDEPSFPHQSTANQFFTEVQFEAYRALGEHVGDKMFLSALTGFTDNSNTDLETWFKALGNSFLDPLVQFAPVDLGKDEVVSP